MDCTPSLRTIYHLKNVHRISLLVLESDIVYVNFIVKVNTFNF
jgi:hypothetical protein